MYDLAIFSALAWERRAVLSALRNVVAGSTPRTWEGRLIDGSSCVVMQTGVGPAHAHRVVSAAPDPRVFLSSGCAGAPVDTLRPGDIVVAEADFAKIKVPTWIVDGDHDEMITPDQPRTMFDWTPGTGLLIEPDVSQFGFIQAPDQFNADVKRSCRPADPADSSVRTGRLCRATARAS